MTNNKQCPNCHMFKTQSQRQRNLLMGIMCISFGLLLIWLPFLGWPLLLIGIASFIVGLTTPKNLYHCNICKNNFKA